jgi:hypothetical protein
MKKNRRVSGCWEGFGPKKLERKQIAKDKPEEGLRPLFRINRTELESKKESKRWIEGGSKTLQTFSNFFIWIQNNFKVCKYLRLSFNSK